MECRAQTKREKEKRVKKEVKEGKIGIKERKIKKGPKRVNTHSREMPCIR